MISTQSYSCWPKIIQHHDNASNLDITATRQWHKTIKLQYSFNPTPITFCFIYVNFKCFVLYETNVKHFLWVVYLSPHYGFTNTKSALPPSKTRKMRQNIQKQCLIWIVCLEFQSVICLLTLFVYVAFYFHAGD